MDGALYLVIGTVLVCLAVPSLVAAMMDRRFPMVALLVFCAGAGLILAVAVGRHGGVPSDTDSATRFATETVPAVLLLVPHAFVEIAGRVIAGIY
ncbi:hypothetical protein [Pseudooceanicola sp.]|jgi:hypothetical protein|uniref:hypothetical protein n=1 Tax=Pseudooceanicola sp. TaxID=1914328 RepID=UPI0040587FA9